MCKECDKRDGTNFYRDTHDEEGPDNTSVAEKIVIPEEEQKAQEEKIESGEQGAGDGPQFITPQSETPV